VSGPVSGVGSDTRVRLASRILITWVELVAVGFAGALFGEFVSGPPQLIGYLLTVLALVGVLLYNVDRLVLGRVTDVQ
jgi:hypothetical protein